jgi:hypothetical protein
MRPKSQSLPALGIQLQKMLAAPQEHTIGQTAAVIERLLAELQLTRHNVPTQWEADASDDGSLEALFAAGLIDDPLTADDVGTLAKQLSAE